MRTKCEGCGLVSFANEPSCKRCGAALMGELPPLQGGYGGVAQTVRTNDAPKRSMGVGLLGFLVAIALTAVVAFVVSGRVGKAKPSWRDFTAPDGRFTASFPAYPEEQVFEPGKNGMGTDARGYIAEVPGVGGTLVLYYDLTRILDKVGSVTKPQREKVMQKLDASLKDEVKKNLSCTITEQHWVPGPDVDGIEAEGTVDKSPKNKSVLPGGKMALRVFWAPPDRIYIVFVYGTEAGEIYQARENVFDSVKTQ